LNTTSDIEYLAGHFHDRAALGEERHQRGFTVDAKIVVSTALDALGEIWLHDFPADRAALEKELGGTISPALRMARLVRLFAAGAPHHAKVAVFLFAEDWATHVPAAAADAEVLLAPRRPQMRGQLPHAHMDVSAQEVMRECPAISGNPMLQAILEEYEYPALFYRFVRSALVHHGTGARRTHGFTRGDEVFYLPVERGTTIGFGIGVAAGWLRAAVDGYVALCTQENVRPATDMDSGAEGEDRLRARWQRIAAGGRR